MTIRAGSSSIRMTVSEVWNGTPDPLMTSGTTGWLPVAMTTWSAVRLSPVETSRARGAGEAGAAEEDGRVLAMGPVVLAAARDGVDPAEDAVADVLPAHAVRVASMPKPGAGGDGVGDVGGVDEHLGGDAADVQAGAAEGAALDDRDLLVLEVRRDEGVAGAGPDDREVEVRHAVQPRASSSSTPRPHAQTWWFCTPTPRTARTRHPRVVVCTAPARTWWFCSPPRPLPPLRRRLATLLPVSLPHRPRPRRRLPVLLGACGLVLGMAACGGGPATPRASAPAADAPRTFDLEAHRGGAGLTVESTLAAFGHALDLGVTTLELDTQITRDGRAVVTHDPTVDGASAVTPRRPRRATRHTRMSEST